MLIRDIEDGLVSRWYDKSGNLQDESSMLPIVEQLKKLDQVILYHGTSTKYMESILSEGLLPREMTENSNYGEESKTAGEESFSDRIYFGARDTAIQLGSNATNMQEAFNEGHMTVIFRVLLNTNQLVPDEDSKKDTWYWSLAWEHSAAQIGIVPPEQILGYEVRTSHTFHWKKDGLDYTALRPDPNDLILPDDPKWLQPEIKFTRIERMVRWISRTKNRWTPESLGIEAYNSSK